jgi:hypothetical protein
MKFYRGGICVTDGTDACIGGDATAESGVGSLIGYLKSDGGTGTVPVYRSTCYAPSGSCTGWGLTLDQNGTAVGYLSTTAPDGPSASNPFVQSNGVLLQGIPGTPSAYLDSGNGVSRDICDSEEPTGVIGTELRLFHRSGEPATMCSTHINRTCSGFIIGAIAAFEFVRPCGFLDSYR